jgi:hypothetical protein
MGYNDSIQVCGLEVSREEAAFNLDRGQAGIYENGGPSIRHVDGVPFTPTGKYAYAGYWMLDTGYWPFAIINHQSSIVNQKPLSVSFNLQFSIFNGQLWAS